MTNYTVFEDNNLRSFATPTQIEYIESYIQSDSLAEAAKHIGKDVETVRKGLNAVLANAFVRGYNVDSRTFNVIPQGFSVERATTTIDGEGNIKLQHIKSKADDDKLYEIFVKQVEEYCGKIKPIPKIQPPKNRNNKLLNLYTLSDAHIGSYASALESGDKWDLEIAEKVITGCFELMLLNSPDSHTCIINQLGDWLHYDSLKKLTPKSGHLLDSSGNFIEMAVVGFRVLNNVIRLALESHSRVVVALSIGNHDQTSAIKDRIALEYIYKDNPRVTILPVENPYSAFKFGDNMLGFHHGDFKKPDHLPTYFAAEYPKIWGNTIYRFFHCGDKHHYYEKEHSGGIVVQHPTLEGRDAYASWHGWKSMRRALSITYHENKGEVGRNYVTPEMLEN